MQGTAGILAAAAADKSEVPKFSFEYFPPKTPAGVDALYKRVYRMTRQRPLFIDLTWGAGGSTSDLTMEMSTNFKKLFGVEVNMHLTCTNITAESVGSALVQAKENGLTSICALRGDPPVGSEAWVDTEGGFNCALDLVKFIRKTHGDHFSLSVSGYPEGHPNAIKDVEDESKLTEAERARVITLDGGKLAVCYDKDFATEIGYLKEKCDAGANLILTQLFYDADVFLTFVDTCRAAGITVPILPGIMPIGAYGGFKRMTGFCKTRVPAAMAAKLEEIKDDAKAVTQFGIDYCTTLSKKILATGKIPSLHFYCLNQHETVFSILRNLGVTIDPLDSEADQAEIAKVVEQVKGLSNTDEASSKKAKVDA